MILYFNIVNFEVVSRMSVGHTTIYSMGIDPFLSQPVIRPRRPKIAANIISKTPLAHVCHGYPMSDLTETSVIWERGNNTRFA